MTKEQAQNLKIGDKIKLAEPLTVIDPKGVSEKILAQTQEGHLVFVEPHETQLAEPAPSEASHDEATAQVGKYDPCRLFKERDKVRPIVHKGRIFSLYWKNLIGKTLTVTKSEDAFGSPEVNGQPIDPAYLELIIPVEEMEPYMVKELKDSFIVYHDCTKIVLNDTSLLAKFMKASHPNAKAAAQAECDRLNAEHRKEQE